MFWLHRAWVQWPRLSPRWIMCVNYFAINRVSHWSLLNSYLVNLPFQSCQQHSIGHFTHQFQWGKGPEAWPMYGCLSSCSLIHHCVSFEEAGYTSKENCNTENKRYNCESASSPNLFENIFHEKHNCVWCK